MNEVAVRDILSLDYDSLTEEEKAIKDVCVDKIISKVLEKKYGIPNKLLIFQEDIMALCSYGAGFTLGEADDIRRAMGKKKMDLMLSFKDKFIENWNKNVGIFGKEVWDKMVNYAEYCFNKAHAVSYSLVTLKTLVLQKYYFKDYMTWNYLNLDKLRDEVAEIVLKENNSPLKFPTFKSPYRGIEIGDICVKEIVIDEQYSDYQKDYEYLSDLFLTSDTAYKLKFFLRGLFDPWTKDIFGLIQLKKKLGKKSDCGFGVIPSTNNFNEFLKNLSMKKYIVYKDLPEFWLVTNKVLKTPEEKDWIRIYKSIDSMPFEIRKYRVSSLKKEFGIPKSSDLSTFNFDGEKEIEVINEKYLEIFNKFKENNPGANISNVVYNEILRRTTSLNQKVKKLESSYGVLRACVKDIKIKSDGSCKLELIFANGSKIFYTRSKDIKTNFQKNCIVDVEITFYQYLTRSKTHRILFNIEAA